VTREGDNSVGATAMSERRRGLRDGTQPRFGRWIDRADLDRLLQVMTCMERDDPVPLDPASGAALPIVPTHQPSRCYRVLRHFPISDSGVPVGQNTSVPQSSTIFPLRKWYQLIEPTAHCWPYGGEPGR
jgi:hypothetical protein